MIWSIKYIEDQIVEWEPYLNSVKTIKEKSYLFEHGVILQLKDRIQLDEWTGFISYKFPYKTGFFKKKVQRILENSADDTIISFCKNIPNYLKWTEKQHPGFLHLFNPICNDLEISAREPNTAVYSSFWFARGDIYLRYINQCLIPAVNLLETKYKDLAWQDSTYQGLSKEELFKYTGLSYYPMHTFVLERLIGNWANTNKIQITNYVS